MGKKSNTSLGNKSLRSQERKKGKRKNKFKNKKNKSNANIKKLFDQLRNESESSSSDTTVIEIDDTIVMKESPINNNNIKENNSNLIIIKDDDDLIINNKPCNFLNPQHIDGPLQSSTPKSQKSIHILTEIISKNSSQVNNTLRNSAKMFQEDIENLTKEINKDSYLTIDLTTETHNSTVQSEPTVIDLANTSDGLDCRLKSSSFSMSGDSDVTVINTAKRRKRKLSSDEFKKFTQGIAKMNSSEKGRLLEYITQTIFNGCNGPNASSSSIQKKVNQSTETVEDAYIKEVILGQVRSRNSIGSNIYNPEKDMKNKTGLRMVVIDGSNVAMQHTKGRVFSVKGLKICIDYFVQRGHVVKAFVPHFRCKYGKSTDGKLLDQLERQGLVVYTPSREIQGRMITSYDDRYIVQCAAEFDGVIVSGDNYRDLLQENPRWRYVIENRLLQFTWVGDMIMFPKDPLGKNGPSLQELLRHPL